MIKMQFAGNLNRQFNGAERFLDYNGRLFRFKEENIPCLNGNGLIVIVTKPGLQYQGHIGSFDNIDMRQIDGTSFINGTSVDDLILGMEELKD